jgi:hypothetical protein
MDDAVRKVSMLPVWFILKKNFALSKDLKVTVVKPGNAYFGGD